jgi:hypothetical protein
MTYKLILIVFVALQTWGCSSHMHSFHWLNGTWEMPKPNGGYRLETWEETDRRMMTGKGLKLVGTDTTLLESIQLSVDRKNTWYMPAVVDQNADAPVAFKMVSATSHQFVFENPHHDFPQRIVYHFKPILREKEMMTSAGDTLDVAVTNLDGEGINFHFTRK